MTDDKPLIEGFNQYILDEIPGRVLVFTMLTMFGFMQIWLLNEVATEEQAAELTQPLLLGLDVYGMFGVLFTIYLFEPVLRFGLRYWHENVGKGMVIGSVSVVMIQVVI